MPTVNPEMVRLARESRDLTQADVAATLRITQGKVSKVEAGLLEFAPAELEAFGDMVGRPVSFFYWTDSILGFEAHEIFHRRRQQVPARTLVGIHADMNIRRMQLERLLRSAEIVGSGFSQLDPDEHGGDIEKIAAMVRSMWHVPAGPLRNVTEVVESAGGVIIPFDFGTQKVDAISQWIPGMPPTFYLNTQFPADRTRWSCCHEVGHIIMHRIIGPDAEEEANRFAAEFLMPSSEIRQHLYNLTLAKLADLKQYWKVSMQALLSRASDLGTITPRQSRRLWMRLSALGYRKQEPYSLPPEKPVLYAELFEWHRRELGYSFEELADLLGERQVQAAWSRSSSSLSIVA